MLEDGAQEIMFLVSLPNDSDAQQYLEPFPKSAKFEIIAFPCNFHTHYVKSSPPELALKQHVMWPDHSS